MHLPTILAFFLASVAFAALEARQTSLDAGFQSAASTLISTYIPPPVFSELSASVVVAASAARVTGDANSLIYSALEASCLPVWFLGAVPITYLGDFAKLEVQLAALRTSIPPPPPPQPTTAAGPAATSEAVPPAVPTESATGSPSLTISPVTVTQTSPATTVTLSGPGTGGGVPGSTGTNVSGSNTSGAPGSGASSASTASTASAPASGTTLALTSSSSAAAAPTGVVGRLAAGIVAAVGAVAAL